MTTPIMNIDYMRYTYSHRVAVRFVINKIIKDEALKAEMLKRAEDHDMDKQMLYLLGVPKKVASHWHRTHASHHMENNIVKSIYDMIEAVVDYESAGYTKPDKPLNAYDTIRQYKPHLEAELMPILRSFGIDMSDANTPDDIEYRRFAQKYDSSHSQEFTEMMIAEVIQYAARNPEKASELVVTANILKAANAIDSLK